MATRIFLSIKYPDGTTKRVSFNRSNILIGRAEGNDLVVKDSRVSSCHGQIVERNGKLFYQDLRSTNGSLVEKGEERYIVDGRSVQEIEINSGDRILIGDAETPVVIEVKVEQTEATKKHLQLDKSKTIVAEQAILDYVALVPQRLSDSDKLHLLFSFMSKLDSLDSESALYNALGKAVANAFPAAGVVCYAMPTLKRETPESVFERISDPLQYAVVKKLEGLIDEISQTRKALLLDPRKDKNTLIKGVASAIVAPVVAESKVEAAVFVIGSDNDEPFNEDDLTFVSVLTSLAGGRIWLLRLVDELRVERRRLEVENKMLRSSVAGTTPRFEMIGECPAIKEVKRQILQVARTDIPVLILGETGTGKELVARAIHAASERSNRTFAAINCGAIPENLLESELFGYVKGAFTGATESKKGLFETANGGTLFLDEIGDMPLQLQVKLLRALEEGSILPLGSTKPVPIDVRIVCATNQNIEELVAEGKFRKDLFYRINGFTITLPPLKERGNDVILLAEHFIAQFAEHLGIKKPQLSDSAKELLLSYHWPGNVRQLRNEIQRALLLSGEEDELLPEHFSAALVCQTEESESLTLEDYSGRTLKEIMEEYETKVIISVLESCGWNKSEAARRLGISRQALMLKLSKLGIAKPNRR